MVKMVSNNYKKIGFYFSIIALVISLGTLYINWQSILFNNRPYIKISPIKFDNTKRYYFFEKIKTNEYILNFKFKIENLGRVPANGIQVKGLVYAFLAKLENIPEEKIKDESLKKIFGDLRDSKVIEFKQLSDEQINGIEEWKKVLDEMKSKDIKVEKMARTWNQLSLFPGESFVFIQKNKVYGNDAIWFVKNFNKMRSFRLELNVFYWGILLKVGHPYHSRMVVAFEKEEILPYESESF